MDERMPGLSTEIGGSELRDRIAEQLVWDFTAALCPLNGPCDACDCFDPRHEHIRAEADKIIGIVREWIGEWISCGDAARDAASDTTVKAGARLAPLPEPTSSSSVTGTRNAASGFVNTIWRKWTKWVR